MEWMDAVEHLGEGYAATPRNTYARALAAGEAAADTVVAKTIEPSVEAVEVKGSTVTFVGTSSKLDRDNDVIRAAGVDHDNWKKRPVILAGHDARVRIGRGSAAELRAGRWVITADYYPRDISPIAAEMKAMLDWNLANKGLGDVGAVYSIGFRSIKAAWVEARGGVDFDKTETLEYSDVSMAANPAARLLEAKAAGVSLDATFDWAELCRCEGGKDFVREDFAQKLIELIDPAKGLKLIELTPDHLSRLKIDQPAKEPEMKDTANAAAFAVRAARLGATDEQITDLAKAAGLELEIDSASCEQVALTEPGAAPEAVTEPVVQISTEKLDEIAAGAYIDAYVAKYGHLPEEN